MPMMITQRLKRIQERVVLDIDTKVISNAIHIYFRVFDIVLKLFHKGLLN